MPGRTPQFYQPRTVVDASPAAAAETVVCTFTGVDTVDGSSVVFLLAQCNITIGATGAGFRGRVRQTSLTGTVVGDTGALTAVAGNILCVTWNSIDSPGVVASFVYVMTVAIQGATGSSTVSAVNLTPCVF